MIRLISGLLFVCALSLTSISPLYATHIMGGNVELSKVGNTVGEYKIILKVYIDLAGITNAESDHFVGIFRKSDDAEMQVFNLPLASSKLVIYENETCTETRRLKTLFAQYERTIKLDPAMYTDPAGYYLSWNNCCRNGDIINIVGPTVTTTNLRTYFPPLISSGKPFLNSSPAFEELDGAYICINEPFRFPFNAKDPDGDELRYSMRNPMGYNSNSNSQPQWKSPYSAENAIPGNPALNVDPKKGELFVNPNQLGLFVFSVVVEELRDGAVIGSVQRDYQLYVVDCPPTSPPDPTIKVDGQQVTEASVCDGKSVTLSAVKNSDWNYQWKKDGKNIEGATSTELPVSESGEYQLVTSLAGTCSKTSRSSIVTIQVTKSNFDLKSNGKPVICTTNGSLTLYAIKNTGYTYEWFRGGFKVPGNADSLFVTEPGRYWAIVNDNTNGCKSLSDTINVATTPGSPATLSPSDSRTALCQGDSILLLASKGSDFQYVWYRNNQIISPNTESIYIDDVGLYHVEIIDSSGCLNKTNTIDITLSNQIEITIQPVDPICGTGDKAIPLSAAPAGGIFTGPGVEGGVFNPQKAGIGMHEIVYSMDDSSTCKSSGKTDIVVYPSPFADAGRDIFVQEGESGQIGTPPAGNLIYGWQPPTGLDSPNMPITLVTPSQNTEYILTVTDENGCINQDTVMVEISYKVLIPDAFTPDGDGINETWELRGISSYPGAEITIFDRWGSVIFHSKSYSTAFNGKYKEQLLPSGAYPYIIKLDSTKPRITGSLILIR